MKVISKPVAFWSHEFTCKQCFARLSAETDDVRFMEGDRPGEPGALYVTCPECNHREWIPDTVSVPYTVRAAALAKPARG